LREILDTLSHHYPFVVMDNEAGMEHLSRRTTRNVQHLYVISDPTLRGIVAAERIFELKDELEIQIENAYLVLNRVPGELPAPLQERIDAMEVPFLGSIPANQEIMSYDFSGKPLLELGDQSAVYRAVAEMLDQTLGL
jgi:CO dehydrogenase maturation factor